MSNIDELNQKRQILRQQIQKIKDQHGVLVAKLEEIQFEISRLERRKYSKGPGRPKGYSLKLGRYFTNEELAELANKKSTKRPVGRPAGWRKSDTVNKI